MRDLADADLIRRFMRAIGREATQPGRMFFTGGATAVLLGWRPTTIDVDVKLVPEQDAVLRGIAALKDALSINVELAAPDDFVPVVDGWADRSPFVATEGRLTFYHFDLTAQALAKIERGHDQDLQDVREMLTRGLVSADGLRTAFGTIEPRLYRYPAISPKVFRQALERMLDARA